MIMINLKMIGYSVAQMLLISTFAAIIVASGSGDSDRKTF